MRKGRVTTSPVSLAAFFSLTVLSLLLLFGFGQPALADEDKSEEKKGDSHSKKEWRYRFEYKRQFTDRGTPGENTRSNFRFEVLPDSLISLFRLDIPFIDSKQSFEGDITSPRLGDLKIRLGFRRFAFIGLPLSFFLENTFPTSDPSSLGNGKDQLSPGVETIVPFFT